MISAYLDDSQTDQRLWIVAGVAGYPNQWEFFERLWAAVLATHGVPYFHVREMAMPTGTFARWHPPEKHEDEVTACLSDVVRAIRDPYLHMFGSAVYLQDLEQFNADKRLDLKPYSLAVYACMTQLAGQFGNLPVTAIFDRVEQIEDRLAVAHSYAESITPGLISTITSVPLDAGLNSRTVPALQAADFVVWEQRRAQTTLERERKTAKKTLEKTREQLWEEYRVWSRLNHGREYPLQRTSLDALTEAKLSADLIVWDYQRLSQVHDLRGGVWAPPQS